MLKATQVAAGEENGLRLRVYGEKGGLEWSQMEPNTLTSAGSTGRWKSSARAAPASIR